MLTNPVLVSVLVLCLLCLLKLNVLFSMLIAALIAAVMGHIPIPQAMELFTAGFRVNANSALADLLLGAFASSIAYTGLSDLFAQRLSGAVGGRRIFLLMGLAGAACLSQNLIPVHIAFIPIMIPPLLKLMDRAKIDRRAASCALHFGLKAPCIMIPFGFGGIFVRLLADNLTANGLPVEVSDITRCGWMLGASMLAGLLVAVFITYRRPREYEARAAAIPEPRAESNQNPKTFAVAGLAIAVVLAVQIVINDLSVSALCGLIVLFGFGAVRREDIENQFANGMRMMGMIVFIMLAAGGYAEVLKAAGGVRELSEAVAGLIGDSRLAAAVVINLIGFLVTVGIGSSFSAIPVVTVLYVPLCQQMSFSKSAVIVLISAAVLFGGIASPASDTALGSTAGLNADGQHDHIRDTCIPAFFHLSLPLLLVSVLLSQII